MDAADGVIPTRSATSRRVILDRPVGTFAINSPLPCFIDKALKKITPVRDRRGLIDKADASHKLT
jgi:hypothetical protein